MLWLDVGSIPTRLTLASVVARRPPTAPMTRQVSRARHEACDPPITRFQLSHLTRDFVYDLTKAREQLGYAPTIDLPQGLETVELPA